MTAPTPHERAVEAGAQAVYDLITPGTFTCGDIARTAIQAYTAAMEAEGWKMVPREGSPKIGAAMMAKNMAGGDMAEIWEAGFDAAPSPSPQREG